MASPRSALHGDSQDPSFLFPSALSFEMGDATPNKIAAAANISNRPHEVVANGVGSAIGTSIRNPSHPRQLPDHLSNIVKKVDEVKDFHQERDDSLRAFIQKELSELRAALETTIAFEVQNSKEELAMSMEKMKTTVDSHVDSQPHQRTQQMIENVAHKVGDLSMEVRGTSKSAEKMQDFTNGNGVLQIPQQGAEVYGTPQLGTQGDVPEGLSVWNDFQEAVDDINTETQRRLYKKVMRRNKPKQSFWHRMAEMLGFDGWLHEEPPNNCLARITEQYWFVTLQTLMILSNAAIMGYESDYSIKEALRPEGQKLGMPAWLKTTDVLYNIGFLLEVSFRIVALRSWFWVAPGDWGWNLFDVIVVLFSLVLDIFSGINLSFIRTFRILRAVRAARIIRILKFFRELRKILFAILGSLASLLWCFLFLGMTMFMFGIFFLQGLTQSVADLHAGSPQDEEDLVLTRVWWSSMLQGMFSLLVAFTGGSDWMLIREPLLRAGHLYSSAFVVYILFVTVGVMNVLTGVFLGNASDFADHSLIVQNEQVRVDNFVKQMNELFSDFDIGRTGTMDWESFRAAMSDEGVQAYLSAIDMEPTHARFIFDLLDDKNHGELHINDFVVGMLRLKGAAKVVDARILQREIGMLPQLLNRAVKAKGNHSGHL